MSLATSCPSCGTVFRVVQDQLKTSEGWVRCGQCQEVFNALEGLFDLDRRESSATTRSGIAQTPRPAPQPSLPPPGHDPNDPAWAETRPAMFSGSKSSLPPPAPPRPQQQVHIGTRHAATWDPSVQDSGMSMAPTQPDTGSWRLLRAPSSPDGALATEADASDSLLAPAPSEPHDDQGYPATTLEFRSEAFSAFASAKLQQRHGRPDVDLTLPDPAPVMPPPPRPMPAFAPRQEPAAAPAPVRPEPEEEAAPSTPPRSSALAEPEPEQVPLQEEPAASGIPLPQVADAPAAQVATATPDDEPPPPEAEAPQPPPTAPEASASHEAQEASEVQLPPAEMLPLTATAAETPAERVAQDVVGATAGPDAAPADTMPAAVPRSGEDHFEKTIDLTSELLAPQRPGANAQATQAEPAGLPPREPVVEETPPEEAATSRTEAQDAATDATPAGGPEIDPEPTLDFIRKANNQARWQRPWVRGALGASALCLTLTLMAQVGVQWRDRFGARWPVLQPLLETLCQCQLQPPRLLDALVVDSTSLTRPPGASGFLLGVTLHNRAEHPVAAPHIELSLTDTRGQVVLRRVLTPTEFRQPGMLPGQADAIWSLEFTSSDSRITGYTLAAFYP